MNYYEIHDLSNIYLEDSYVLAFHEVVGSLIFELEAVLTELHPLYEIPKEGEQYCYKRALLSFLDVSLCEWLEKSVVSYFDKTGAIDFGNIDIFTSKGSRFTLSGDWGKIIIECATVDFVVIG